MNKYFRIWLYLLFIKIVAATFIPLFADEAYYWVWSKNLQLSYYDHPGMIAWLFWLGSPLENFFQAGRVPAVILGHIAIWLWFDLLQAHLDNDKKNWLLFGLSLIPLSGLGALILTPDLPLVFCWTLCVWSLNKILSEPKLKWYLALGASFGLGFCAKYHIVLFVPALLIFLYREKQSYKIRWSYVAYAGATAIVFSFPTWLWNIQNDFASFRFQLNHGLSQKENSLLWPARYVLEQLLLIFPTILIFSFSKIRDSSLRWLPYFAWTPLIFFFLTSFKGRVEANWPITAYPALFAIALINSQGGLIWIKRTVVFWFALLILVLSQISFSWIPVNSLTKKTEEIYQYRTLLPYTEKFNNIFTSTYQMAALLSFHQKSPFFKLHGVGRKDFYDYLPAAQPKSSSFFWYADKNQTLPEWAAEYGYSIVGATPISDFTFLYEVKRK